MRSCLLVAVVGACSQVIDVPVRLGSEEECREFLDLLPAPPDGEVVLCQDDDRCVQSVRARAVRRDSDGEFEPLEEEVCLPMSGMSDAQDLLDAFDDRGLFVGDVPVSDPTVLQLVGYDTDDCGPRTADDPADDLCGPHPLPDPTEELCGYTFPPVADGDPPAEGVGACFVCTEAALRGCMSLPTRGDR